MSWFDSLSSIKGQISSLASEVLADGIATDADPSKSKIEELHNFVANQESQIRLLQRENEELQEKVLRRPLIKENEAGNDDGWSWDPPDSVENSGRAVSELTRKVDLLESEKKDLINSLEQLDLDCQQTTDKLVTIKDELQNENIRISREYDDVKNKNKLLLKLNDENQKKITALERNAAASKQASDLALKNAELEAQLKELNEKYANLEQNEINVLRKSVEELSVANKELKPNSSLIQVEDNNKLETILHEYESLVKTYKQELISLKSSNKDLQANVNENLRLLPQLQQENKNLKSEIENLNVKLDELKQLNDRLNAEHNNLKLSSAASDENSKSDKFHKRFVEMLQTSISKCTDNKIVLEIESGSHTEIVETIAKLILDYKLRCETLDKTVFNLTEEKKRILAEKNHEIEKLIRNSEDLSNEIILKGQDLKHYEDECAELIKNNELLITRLDEMKNASGLQTIPETNEDNMLQLENQLDKSHKRIEELENMVSDIESSKQSSSVDSQSELEYVKNQLNMTGEELSVAKKEYQTLSNNYKQLETDNDSLKHNLEDMKYNYKECYTEMEGTEFKYAEQNINLETLKEEVDTHLKSIEELTKENKKLEILKVDIESKNELMMKEVDDLKQELTLELESSQQKDIQMQILIEKLQNQKLFETNLKLQFDSLSKEHQYLVDLKGVAETNFQKLNSEVIGYTGKILELTGEVVGLQTRNQILVNNNKSLKDEITTVRQNLASKQSAEKSNNFQDLLAEKNRLSDELTHLQNQLKEKDVIITELKTEFDEIKSQYENLAHEKLQLQADFDNFKSSVAENNCATDDTQKVAALELQINELSAANEEMILLIKEKHQENVNYHLEIQRLHQSLAGESEKSRTFEAQLQDLNATSVSAEELARKDEAIEKLTDQNGFLREKCTVLAESLLQEQSNVQRAAAERSETSDRELALQKKLDNLREHLIAVEESYTKEVQQAERRCEEMQAKLQEVEQREKHSSNRYTSVNIRANQQVETLQTQLQLITNQRDELKKKLSDFEDEVGKQKAALTNLHIVLQQFQRDKDYDINNETERMNRQVQVEKQTQDALKKEVGDLKLQLDESKQGLKAAVRLSDQVEASKRQVASMKEEAHGFSMFDDACQGPEMAKLQHQLERSEEKYNKYISQTDGKVDKMLIKNLIIGLISSNNNLTKDQNQILKIISTVLDFNQQDIEKVRLNRSQEHSWFGSLLHPQALGGQNLTQESLSLAFVKFLEAESKPRELPNLLETASAVTASTTKCESSASSSVRQSPIVLNEIVLPTFADFGQSRNSSSILKDVLKDPSNS